MSGEWLACSPRSLSNAQQKQIGIGKKGIEHEITYCGHNSFKHSRHCPLPLLTSLPRLLKMQVLYLLLFCSLSASTRTNRILPTSTKYKVQSTKCAKRFPHTASHAFTEQGSTVLYCLSASTSTKCATRFPQRLKWPPQSPR